MIKRLDTPLLLLDNSSMMSVINQGEFKCTNMTFEETKAILDMHDETNTIRCFTDNDIENIIFNYLDIEKRDFTYKHVGNMRIDQDTIVFKLYCTRSSTQPIIYTADGVEAKKIQNIYIYCQFISRTK